jgi:hypothetical protein
METEDTLQQLEAELTRQDEELAQATSQLQELAGKARFEVPQSFFDDLEEACRPRRETLPTQFVFGLRG